MEILDLNANDKLEDWGIELVPNKTKTLVFGDKSEEYKVYKIPVDILVYNPSNGRMFMEAKRYENEEKVKLADLRNSDPKKYNDEVENLIWSTNEERNNATKRDISKFGQIEPGVVLNDGTVVDGNRRFTCVRRLHNENPDNEKFSYFLAAIVKVDGKNITPKIIKEFEIRTQFNTDEKVDYNVVNKNMSIYELIKNQSFSFSSIAELLGNGTTSGDIKKIYNTCELIDEFLEYIEKPGEYQIAEDRKIYWPLEPLVAYLSKEGKNLSPLEVQERKHLFFDYLIELDVSLITQNLRDELIKKVFKDKNETKELIDKHKETIGKKIHEVIKKSKSADDFSESVKDLRNSAEANEDKEIYENKVNKLKAKNQLDIPFNECKNALKCLENVNVKPLVDASNEIAEKKLEEIKEKLDDIIKKANAIKNSMKK